MTIYMCEDSVDGILCGVYDAWMSRKGHANVRLQQIGENETMELFAEYEPVIVSREKADQVIGSIRRKISEEVYQTVYKAALSKASDRADKIYRFLICGFHYGKPVLDMLQVPAVNDIFTICRHLDHETHLTLEFVRFSETESGFLVSHVGPKNDVLVFIAPHFADRMPEENWVIIDDNRMTAVLHPAGRGWVQAHLSRDEWLHGFVRTEEEELYKTLWCAFRKSVAIRERYNPKCQRTHMPYRYRPYMTEFEKNIVDEK